MKGTPKTALTHFFTWLFFAVIYFFSSEGITRILFHGYDGVELWLGVLGIGQILIFLVVLVSLILSIWKPKKNS